MNTFISLAMVLFVATVLHVSALSAHPPGFGRDGRGSLQYRIEEMNRKIVLKFYQELFGDHDLTSIDRYIHEHTYIQHNPHVADGRQAFKTAAATWFDGVPKTKIDIRRSASEGDLVWLHVKHNNKAVVDIFRLDCGKIVEHWDVIQEIPTKAANSHPFFT